MMLHEPARAPSSAPSLALRRAPERLQRACACDQEAEPAGKCRACRDGDTRLRRRGRECHEPQTVPAIVGSVLASSGQPLDLPTRVLFESRFGHDFGRVRVHSDESAAAAASTVNAEAYTVGPHIVFGAGRYAPGTQAGRLLLAHELAHTIQQGEGPHPVPSRVGDASDHGEREAEALAIQALHEGSAAGARRSWSSGPPRSPAALSGLARQQTRWPAWHQDALREIARVAGKSDGTTADADFPLLEPWLCTLTPGMAGSLLTRLGPGAAGARAGTDDFAVYVKSKFPTKHSELLRMLRDIAGGKVPEECKKEDEDGDGNGDGNGDGKPNGNGETDGQEGGPAHPNCPKACQALKSMRGSVKGICKLAGDDSEECKNAKKKLKVNERRVRRKGCGCAPKPIPKPIPNV